VGRGDEVDVEGALSLQVEHDFGQLGILDRPALTQPTDLIVLTEETAQVAAAEKNRSRSSARPGGRSGVGAILQAAENGFLPKMKQRGGDRSPGAAPAYAGRFFPPIDMAGPRAKGTIGFQAFQRVQGAVDSSDFSFAHDGSQIFSFTRIRSRKFMGLQKAPS
jgi:hypothetical protein